MPEDYFVRPMRLDDVPDVERLTDEGFHDVDLRTLRAGEPAPERRSAAASETWREMARHMVRTDPGGCFVAEDRAGPLGASVSLRRDLMWILATYVVRPGVQGRGVGRQLLEAALTHGAGCLRGMIASSDDPAAVRRYRLAGFTLHPTMALRGPVPRDVLPVLDRVREGSAGDIDLMDSVDRRVRDAAHGVDHEAMTKTYRLAVVDRSTGQGYVYIRNGGGPYLLAATNRRTATDLLWESLAASTPDEPVTVSHVTAANEWAVDVGMTARMGLRTQGFLALRHMEPPMPYLHSGRFL